MKFKRHIRKVIFTEDSETHEDCGGKKWYNICGYKNPKVGFCWGFEAGGLTSNSEITIAIQNVLDSYPNLLKRYDVKAHPIFNIGVL